MGVCGVNSASRRAAYATCAVVVVVGGGVGIGDEVGVFVHCCSYREDRLVSYVSNIRVHVMQQLLIRLLT